VKWPAGLHEGLRSLIAGGAPPGFLIIDDGWQCTDVDRQLREPPMVRGLIWLSLPCNPTGHHMSASWSHPHAVNMPASGVAPAPAC
jgi:hypothetical protein